MPNAPGFRISAKLTTHQRLAVVGQPFSSSFNRVGRLLTLKTSSPQEVAFYHTRKDGSIFPVSLTRSIISDSKGRNVGVVAVVRDISELVEVEDRIKALNQKLRQETRVIS